MLPTIYVNGAQGQLLSYVATWNMLSEANLTRDPFMVDTSAVGPEADSQLLGSADETIEFGVGLDAAHAYLGAVEEAEGHLMEALGLVPSDLTGLTKVDEFRAVARLARPAWFQTKGRADAILDDLMSLTLNRNAALDYLGDWKSIVEGDRPDRMIDESTVQLNAALARIGATFVSRIKLAERSYGLFEGDPEKCLGAFFDPGMRLEVEALSFEASTRFFHAILND